MMFSLQYAPGMPVLNHGFFSACARTTVQFRITVSAIGIRLADSRSYQLLPPRHRRIVFTMARTESQDLLSFIASPDGKWRLSRVHDWLREQPPGDGIVVRDLAPPTPP